MFKFVVES